MYYNGDSQIIARPTKTNIDNLHLTQPSSDLLWMGFLLLVTGRIYVFRQSVGVLDFSRENKKDWWDLQWAYTLFYHWHICSGVRTDCSFTTPTAIIMYLINLRITPFVNWPCHICDLFDHIKVDNSWWLIHSWWLILLFFQQSSCQERQNPSHRPSCKQSPAEVSSTKQTMCSSAPRPNVGCRWTYQ
jgi:hypothetical protein